MREPVFADLASKMAPMSAQPPQKILIPRWVQLVGLPLLVLGAWRVFEVVNHAVFIFVVAALIAILLNPIVRAFSALHIPRPLAVFLVYLCAAASIGGLTVIAGTVVAREVSSVSTRVESEFQQNRQGVIPAEQKLFRLQRWIDRTSPVKVDVKSPGERLIHGVDQADLQRYSGQAVSIAQSLVITVFESLFNLVLVVVISVYMLLDAPRLSRWLRTIFPSQEPGDDLLARCERALLAYVRGQTLVSLTIGATAGVGMELLGLTGVFPSGSRYALAFGAFTAVTEVIPYVGPWLGALAARGGGGHPVADRRHRGRPGVPLHPPDRGPHRHPQADGRRGQGASAGGHLRPAGGRGAVRAARRSGDHAAGRHRPRDRGVPARADRPGVVARCGADPARVTDRTGDQAEEPPGVERSGPNAA